ncbi:MAG TPA: GMP synthase (glutamine-hydrolyzing) [Spirochaetia bacterium]|nr:MAG: glutamine-hydrolyzing GMP synthase [Spirochaetes bacterium GWB1_36_13]HCL57961.1 GMP synthase (glutamine-hydrolyzing) [Spirochaetia bacterium]
MILILDFGSQYTQLIAKRIRKMKVYCEIHPYSADIQKIAENNRIEGLILSGGPASVYDSDSFKIEKKTLDELNIPILGICYGMQLLSYLYEGKITPSDSREYGFTEIKLDSSSLLFEGLEEKQVVWMSHGDKVVEFPKDFIKAAESKNALASIQNKKKHIYAVQFHPEVVHTKNGGKMLENFVFKICKCIADWEMGSFIDNTVHAVRNQVKDKKVVLGLSGGVDSSVLAVLLHKALGKNLLCVFVNNGVLRKNEALKVQETFTKNYDINFKYIDASKEFLQKLKGIDSPEQKRKIIGEYFLEVFSKTTQGFDFLAQGTLYPDVIESVNVKGPSDTIKTHHNRVGGVLELINQGKVIEPFKELFKDEVREIGRELGVPDEIVNRQPFPGPGLAIRVLGDVTEEKLNTLREADAIIIEEIKNAGLYNQIWQAFGVFLPVQSVGVMGDKRTYENVIALRIVESVDGMTADWVKMPYDVLNKISSRIINEVKGINRVVYDISSKPPATIEWE